MRPLAAAFCVGIFAAGCGGVAKGPLAFPRDAGNSWIAMGVHPNQFGVIGIPLEYRKKSRQAVLIDVHPADPAAAAGARLRLAAEDGVPLGGARGWNPKAWRLRPIRGFAVKRDRTSTVIVGVAAVKGTIFIHSFAVDYRIGETRYRAVYPVGIKICVGTSLYCR
jgi:hypothetical protein